MSVGYWVAYLGWGAVCFTAGYTLGTSHGLKFAVKAMWPRDPANTTSRTET